MVPIDVSFDLSSDVLSPDVRRPGTAWFAACRADPTVVWCRGEHDLATVAALSETMGRAVALDVAGLVIDLSAVQFMDASTVRVIVRTRELLRPRSLVLRSPSRCARRVLELCGLAELVDPPSPDAALVSDALGALRTWVAVPTERAAQPAGGENVKEKVKEIDLHPTGDEHRGTLAGHGGP